MKRRLNVALVLVFLLCAQLFPVSALAAPVVHTVATFEEFNDAVQVINASGGEHVISLQADITDTSPVHFESFSKGETTIIGNGYTLAINDLNQSHIVSAVNSGTVVNLGDKNDSTNTLTLTQIDTGSTLNASGAAIIGNFGSVINMYEGVSVSGYSTSGFTHGAGASFTSSTFNMYGGIIENCEMVQDGYNGAGIAALGGSTITISGDSKISNNISKGRGAGIYANGSSVTISGNALVEGNHATSYGGGMYAQGATIAIEDNAQVAGNKTDTSGGAMMIISATTVTMRDNAKISGNTASIYGGGVYAQDATIILEDSVQITENNATQLAGGLMMNRTTSTMDDTVQIKDNTAGSAGNNLLYYSYDNLFTLNTTENLDPNREQLIDIRYASSAGQLDFAITGAGASTVATNADINKYFSYEVPTLVFDIESVANHLILMEKPKITPTIQYPPEDYVGTAVRDIVKAIDPDTGLEVLGTFTFFDISTGAEIQNPTLQEIAWSPVNANTFGYSFVPADGEKYESIGISPRVTLTINALVATKLPTPTIAVDFLNEKLTGFIADQKYTINGTEFVADATGTIDVDTSYFGTNLEIIAKGDGIGTLDSDAQSLPVPARPSAPQISMGEDGSLSTSSPDVEYSLDGGLTWNPVSGGVITGLPQGQEVVLRIKATTEHFKSETTTVTVSITHTVTFDSNGGSAVPSQKVTDGDAASRPTDPTRSGGYIFNGWLLNGAVYQFTQPVTSSITLLAQWILPTPSVVVDYLNEKLTGFIANQKYTINGTEFVADATGAIDIDASYFGTDLVIIAKGDGVGTLDSDAQNLPVPARPAVPQITVGEDGSISTSSPDVEYSLDGGKTWNPVSEGEITDLPQGQEVVLRVKATTENFKSDTITVTVSIEHTVVFDSSGGSAVPSQKVTDGDVASRPTDPIRNGFTFRGWFEGVALYDFSQPVTESLTLVAQWDEVVTPPIDDDSKTSDKTLPKTSDSLNVWTYVLGSMFFLSLGGFATLKRKR